MSDLKGADKLMAQVKANMEKKKKNKQNNKKTNNKKTVLTNFTEEEINKVVNNTVNVKDEQPTKATKTETPRIEKSNKIMAIVAATGTNIIDESDVRRIFNEISLSNIVSMPGYFIIEFYNNNDLRTALKKNKSTYKNIDILVGEYSEEDEHPKPPRRYDDRYDNYNDRYGGRDSYRYNDNYRGRDNHRYNDRYGDSDNYVPKLFQIGSKKAPELPQNNSGRNTPTYNSDKSTSHSDKFSTRAAGAYVPPSERK